MSLAHELAKIALDIGAIKLAPEQPFTWASGYRMPVYNDNRMLLGNADHRLLVARGFQEILTRENIPVDVVAGTATAGIPPATTLANSLHTPLIYVRAAAKKYGMGNLIEGVLKNDQQVVVVEDLISTGGSALKAVEAIRQAGGQVEHCLSIFHYGFTQAEEAFADKKCRLHSLLTFQSLLEYAEQSGTLSKNQTDLLRPWYGDPFGWGEKHGFPPIQPS